MIYKANNNKNMNKNNNSMNSEKNSIFKGTFPTALALLVVCIFSLTFFAQTTSAATTTLDWNTIYNYTGYGLSFHADGHDGALHADMSSANKVCQVRGYVSAASFTTSSYSSCGDNYYYQWTGSKWQYHNACDSNSYLQTLTCNNVTIACSSNAQCGVNGLTGGAFCQNNGVYRNFTTYTCNNQGTGSSSCTNTSVPQLQNNCSSGQTCSSGSCVNFACSGNSDCGSNGLTGGLFCQGNGVFRNYLTYTCNNPGTASASCTNTTSAQLQNNCSSNQICSLGVCTNVHINCSASTDCGTNSLTGGAFCQNNGVYQNFITYTCNNPGTVSSTCSNATVARLQNTCTGNQTCSNGSCNAVACSSNTDCGTNGLTGGAFCQNNGVYKNFITYTCNNPGTASSSCTNTTAAQLQSACTGNQTCSNGSCNAVACSSNTDCGTNGLTGGAFCQNNGVYKNFITYTCNNPGTASSSCTNTSAAQLQSGCSTNRTCSNGSCSNIACSLNTDCGTNSFTGGPFCQGNGVYKNFVTYTCNNPGTVSSSCTNATAPQLQTTCSGSQTCSGGSCTNTCTTHSYQQCSGNSVYWYDSCGNIQDVAVTCGANQTCSNNSCVVNPNISTCTYHAYQQCIGNNVYWFNSCGAQQELYQSCSYNQTCSNNTCITNQNINTCTYHAYQQCIGNNVYWFNSCGAQQDLYQVCSYGQTCSNNSCITTYQQPVYQPVYQPQYQYPTQQETLTTTEMIRNLSAGNLNWTKSVSANPSDIVQFQVTIQSVVNQTVNNVMVHETFPPNLYYYNNLTVDGASVGGDITAGINIGSVTPGQTRIITYQAQVGPTQNFPYGSTILADPVNVTSTDPNYLQTSTNGATIDVTKNTTPIVQPTSVSTGLTNNIFVDSFFLPLILGIIAIWLWRAGVFSNKTSKQKQFKNRI